MCSNHINVLFQSRFVAGIRFMNNILGKRKGIGNRFTEKWVIKIVKRFCEKFLICFQMKFFAFPKTWLFSYVSLDKSHVFSFLKKSFSMQIKNFLWGLSSDRREFSLEKVVFLPTNRYCLHYKRHPHDISMQILNQTTHPQVLGWSVKVSDRYIYSVKNWLWQWKSHIQKNRVITQKQTAYQVS